MPRPTKQQKIYQDMADDISVLIELGLHNSGISQAELARRVGVSKVHINKIVRGHSVPGLSLFAKIFAEFNYTVSIQAWEEVG